MAPVIGVTGYPERSESDASLVILSRRPCAKRSSTIRSAATTVGACGVPRVLSQDRIRDTTPPQALSVAADVETSDSRLQTSSTSKVGCSGGERQRPSINTRNVAARSRQALEQQMEVHQPGKRAPRFNSPLDGGVDRSGHCLFNCRDVPGTGRSP